MSNRETVIESSSGEIITVETDAQGTRVTDERGGVTTYGGDQHDSAVDDHSRNGGMVISTNFIDGDETRFSPEERVSLSQISGKATRRGNRVVVEIDLVLPETCFSARVTDWYPGGLMKYVRDPGAGQVFIGVSRLDGLPCADALKPWKGRVGIEANDLHKTVQIFINGRQEAEIQIES